MKRFPALLPLVALCLLGVFAAPAMGNYKTGVGESWYWQQPLPQGNTVHDIEMYGAGKGTAVGARGTILHTDDSGATWTADEPQGDYDLYDVEYLDDQVGWIVGDLTVLKTTNGGATWVPQDVGIAEGRYRTIYFVTTSTAFLGGCDGATGAPLFLRTQDGCVTWEDITAQITAPWSYAPDNPSMVWDAHFPQARMGFLAASDFLLRSTNFGDTYWNLSAGGDVELYTVEMARSGDGWPMRGFTAGSAGVMGITIDGGNHWEYAEAPITPDDSVWDLGFTTETTAWAVGDWGMVLRTEDASNWARIDPGGPRAVGYRGLTFDGTDNGWIVGQGGTVLDTTDTGTTWTPRGGSIDDSVTGISVATTQAVWATRGPNIMHTADGGIAWSVQETATVRLNDIEMVNTNDGWSVGESGTILHTGDGATWTDQTSAAATDTLCAVSATSDTTAWACGVGGTVIRTTDGGATWDRQFSTARGTLNDIEFVDGLNGWAVGYDERVLMALIIRTSDGGEHWYWQHPGDLADRYTIHSIDFIDADRGWWVGEGGRAAYTTDGGDHWISAPVGLGDTLVDIQLAGDGSGWIVGEGGTLLHTEGFDAGWGVRTSPSDNELGRVGALGNRVWLCGDFGTILSSFDPGAAVTPPQSPTDFVATGGETQVQLSWTNPPDEDFAAVRILRSETGFASLPTDGGDQTNVYEGAGAAHSDTGLTNGVTYYYTIFARDEYDLWSGPATATATTVNLPPGPVTGLFATAGDNWVLLGWTNPANADYATTRILRSTVGYATTPTDTVGQTIAYEGAGTGAVDTPLTPGETYYYSAFAQDTGGLWSVRATTQVALPEPPPGPVTGFTAVASDSRVSLGWTNPGDADYASTRILRSTSGYATTATPSGSQLQIYDGSATSTVDAACANGVLYYYTAYARDAAGNWSSRATASAQPIGVTTLALSSSATVTAYGSAAALAGDLRDTYAVVPGRSNVGVWQTTNGGASWTQVGTAVYDTGLASYRLSVAPKVNTVYQMRFGGDSGNQACTSNDVTIAVRAYVGKPVAPSPVRLRAYFTVTGLLLPKHGGTTPLKFYRYVSGRWRYYSTRYATNTSSGTATKYSLRTRLLARGRFYVKAFHSDADHAATLSTARYITVL